MKIMTIQQEIFSPDTCNCSMEISYDDAVAVPVYSLVGYITKDSPHAILADLDAFNAVFAENVLKNTAYGAVIANAPVGMTTMVGNNKRLSLNFIFTFAFSGIAPNRTVTLSFTPANATAVALSPIQVQTLQTAVDTAVGAGKTTISSTTISSV